MGNVSAIWISPKAEMETVINGPQILFGKQLDDSGLENGSHEFQKHGCIVRLRPIFSVGMEYGVRAVERRHVTSGEFARIERDRSCLGTRCTFRAVATARKQGYRVYVEMPLNQATPAAKRCAETSCAGIILNVLESESAEIEKSIASLRSAYPNLGFWCSAPMASSPR